MIGGEGDKSDVKSWTTKQVCEWLKSAGHHPYTIRQFGDNDVDGFCLFHMNENDLRSKPLELDSLGEIKRVSAAIRRLQRKEYKVDACSDERHMGSCHQYSRLDSTDSSSRRYARVLKPQIFKTVVSVVYAMAVMFLTAFVMTHVNERVPDMKKYPPLPDLFLENVPFIPWAFHAAEYILMGLGAILLTLLFLHNHRTIILRRICALLGTLYLLRSICMFITTLSVPSKTFHCQRHGDNTLIAKLWRALSIATAGGMSLQGVRYCGDYMFSGHTTLLTLTTLFIDEYSHKHQPYIRTIAWVMNIFGIFFVMAGHEHYSIDVFIAFYLSTRLFVYYHTLADNHSSLRHDKARVRIWFPLFSYFEEGCDGAVPNEFEWPLSWPSIKRKVHNS